MFWCFQSSLNAHAGSVHDIRDKDSRVLEMQGGWNICYKFGVGYRIVGQHWQCTETVLRCSHKSQNRTRGSWLRAAWSLSAGSGYYDPLLARGSEDLCWTQRDGLQFLDVWTRTPSPPTVPTPDRASSKFIKSGTKCAIQHLQIRRSTFRPLFPDLK